MSKPIYTQHIQGFNTIIYPYKDSIEVYHNTEGPAYIALDLNGNRYYEEYWLFGIEYSEKEWKKRVKVLERTKGTVWEKVFHNEL